MLGWALRDTQQGVRPRMCATSDRRVEVCGTHASNITKRGTAWIVVEQRPSPAGTSAKSFPTTPSVTSNLDFKIQTADYGLSGASRRRSGEPGPNPCVIKILTSIPLRLKILQTIVCGTRASQGFSRGWGEGGTRSKVDRTGHSRQSRPRALSRSPCFRSKE